MQNELGYAIWGLRAGTDLILLKKNLVPEVENTLTDIRILTQSHIGFNDFLYMVAKTNNYTSLCMINTKTFDRAGREAFIGISLFYTNNNSLNTSAIPYLQKAMAFYLKMQTIAKSENMFSDEMFIEQFQGLNLVPNNSYNNYNASKQGYIRFSNINEIQDYFIYKNLPSNYTRVYFIKEGNAIDFEGNQIEEIKPNTIIAGPEHAPQRPSTYDPPIIADPIPPIKRIIIILSSFILIAAVAFGIFRGSQKVDETEKDTVKVNPPREIDTPKVVVLPPIDPKPYEPERKFHIVSEGEDLGKISTKTGKYIKELKSLNKQIKNFNDLHKGDTIWLEDMNSSKETKPPSSANPCIAKCLQYSKDLQNKTTEIDAETDGNKKSELTKERDEINANIKLCNCK